MTCLHKVTHFSLHWFASLTSSNRKLNAHVNIGCIFREHAVLPHILHPTPLKTLKKYMYLFFEDLLPYKQNFRALQGSVAVAPIPKVCQVVALLLLKKGIKRHKDAYSGISFVQSFIEARQVV
jgi:hypothetical protein